MRTRDNILWLIWLLFVIGFLARPIGEARSEQLGRRVRTIHFMPNALKSPKGMEQAVPVVRTGLIAEQPSVPYVVIPPSGPKWYFAATAVNEEGLESDFSNEVFHQLKSGQPKTVSLAWDKSESASGNETYKVYRGKQSRAYTDTFKAGTNLTLTIAPSVSKTNRVITVTTQNATNLAYSSKLGVRWTFIGATNWTATNPASMRFWRAVGTKNSSPKVEIGVSYR